MTLSDLEGHLHHFTYCVWFFEHLCNNWQDFNWHRASCAPFAIAELLVEICKRTNRQTDTLIAIFRTPT